ncbi:hypothetical protein QFZ76_000787 [Streptomyces sp. V4I2]|nr:hypothetical protein [Streptomyces sp. V4I2]
MPPGAERQRLPTVTFVGGGFSGVEGFGELLSLATAMLTAYPELSFDDLSFHLVEARDRILPEVTGKPGAWVVRSLERRGAHVHLNTQLISAEGGHVVLSRKPSSMRPAAVLVCDGRTPAESDEFESSVGRQHLSDRRAGRWDALALVGVHLVDGVIGKAWRGQDIRLGGRVARPTGHGGWPYVLDTLTPGPADDRFRGAHRAGVERQDLDACVREQSAPERFGAPAEYPGS